MSSASVITIPANEKIDIKIVEWQPETSETDKKNNRIWHWIEKDGKSVIKQMKGKGDLFNITLPKSLCGSYTYYTRVSLEGVNNSTSAILGFRGYCPQKITKSEWRKSPKGANIANGIPIKYGDTIYLYLETEGLNGEKLTAEVYNQDTLMKDKVIRTITGLEVRDGKVLLKIPNTSFWMGAVFNIQEIEEFYIKVKNAKGQYITSAEGETDLGEYLKIKKEVSSTNIEKPSNTTVLKIGETTVKLNRHEPCKFEEISITETETKDGKATNSTVKVFDNGKGLKSAKGTTEKVTTSIYFKFDVDVVDEKSKQALQNVLNFLLEHPHSGIRLEGYACVIGKQNYNNGLSQRRSDAVKKLFLDGGLKADRILSLGKGEVNATDDKQGRDNIKYKDEKEHINNRRVDVSFTFEGHNAQTIVYETIAPSSDKNILLEVKGFETKSCFKTKDKHTKKIKVTSPAYPAAKVQNGDKMQIPVHSTLNEHNINPLNYIWPRFNILTWNESSNPYYLYIHSCRYFSNEKNNVILVKVFPDIKWELAFEMLINVSNYKAANMPSGNIYAKHQEKAREAGYKRWRISENGKIPISLGLGLSSEWDSGKHKRNFTNEFSDRLNPFIKIFSKSINILQDVINFAQSTAKTTAIPASFDVRYPKVAFVGKWYLERSSKNDLLVTTNGELNLGLKPIIGANIIIDIIGCAIAAASYGLTGNPAAAKLISKFRKGLDKLGSSVTFTATFYGELEAELEALKIIDGAIKNDGKTTIGGKMGVTILLAIEIGGKFNKGSSDVIIPFKAAARLQGDSYFGGYLILNTDDKGRFYTQKVLKFSGLVISGEIEGEIGWWKSNFKLEEKVLDSAEYYFDKTYF